ncbi:unnamed protein product [Cuscuta epithymum]|uniref:Retrotransposon Copia-like N-terminal domain-containing protein n=1 Tax=Cuscuta epithymum TaxID=186058 RepID=A0AAV0FG19_9ASTE|nr:unnamed protein product [Cuscuta epithymum]
MPSSTSTTFMIPTSDSSSQLISLNASSQIPIKLSKEGSNYSFWKSQITNLLFGYGLLDYVTGKKSCPEEKDPGYELRTRQDRLILLAIQSTVAGTISPIINSCSSSADAWTKLETSFASSSTTRMMSLLSSLMTTKKTGKSVTEYLAVMKTFIDDLATIGHPQSTGQIASYILGGLAGEFKDLVGAIRILPSPPTFEQLQDFLREAETLAGESSTTFDVPITAQFSQRRNGSRGRGGRGRGGRSNDLSANSHHNNSGHLFCYGQNSRFGQNSFGGQNSHKSITCQLCDKAGHSAKTCYIRNSAHPTANLVSGGGDISPNNNWLLDTGATHHITSDLNNLHVHSDYNGDDSVAMGDGLNNRGILGPRPE